MSNYEPFFSLQRPLFDSDGGRGFVYESDQLKNAAESFKAAFSKSSPLLCVGGQLGCGKSSTVNYALDQLGEKTRRISLGRIRLSEDEVIDLLLEKLGVEDASGGTIKKLGRFAKCVEKIRADGERVVVIVDDAVRTGSNILSELEILCGGDGGADVALVVCGDEDLRKMLKQPELAPLSHRMNDFIRLAPFAVDELEDYLRHAVREAGGNYDSIFGRDYAGLTHILSCGVPRVANKLTEASLAAAAKAGTPKVSCALLADIARSRFDIETEIPVHRKAPPATAPKPAAPAPTPTAAAPKPAAAAPTPTAAAPAPKPTATAPKPAAPAPTPAAAAAAAAAAKETSSGAASVKAALPPSLRPIPDVGALTGNRAPVLEENPTDDADEPEIPHLIQDTQPELKALREDFKDGNALEETDSSGAFVSLPNLEDLTAEFAAVSQMIESLPISRYDLDEENTEIEDAFSDFGALDEALEPPVEKSPEPEVEQTASIDATSTALPKLSVPKDPTLNEAPTLQIEDPAPRTLSAAHESTPEPKIKASIDVPQPATKTSSPDVPVLKADASDEIELEPTLVEDPADLPAAAPDVKVQAASKPVQQSAPMPDAQAKAGLDKQAIEVTEVKDWDRDPTLAELRPDLDALELAMGEDIELSSEPEPEPVKKPEPAAIQKPTAMPEITLDNSIQEKVQEAASERAADPEKDKPKSSSGPTDTEVHRMMEDLSKSSSLEDMDDRLAETLFGDEINLVASQVLKAARESMDKKNSDASIELSLEQTAENQIPAEAQTEAKKAPEKPDTVPPQYEEDEGEVIDLKSMRPNSGLDMSASQRLRTVRALNAGMGATHPPQKPKAPAAPKEKPVPIEDQIDLSMTATFKALKIDPSALQQQDEEETEKKGFFSRFRKKG